MSITSSFLGVFWGTEPTWFKLAYPYFFHPGRGIIQTAAIYMVVAVATERYRYNYSIIFSLIKGKHIWSTASITELYVIRWSTVKVTTSMLELWPFWRRESSSRAFLNSNSTRRGLAIGRPLSWRTRITCVSAATGSTSSWPACFPWSYCLTWISGSFSRSRSVGVNLSIKHFHVEIPYHAIIQKGFCKRTV